MKLLSTILTNKKSIKEVLQQEQILLGLPLHEAYCYIRAATTIRPTAALGLLILLGLPLHEAHCYIRAATTIRPTAALGVLLLFGSLLLLGLLTH